MIKPTFGALMSCTWGADVKRNWGPPPPPKQNLGRSCMGPYGFGAKCMTSTRIYYKDMFRKDPYIVNNNSSTALANGVQKVIITQYYNEVNSILEEETLLLLLMYFRMMMMMMMMVMIKP